MTAVERELEEIRKKKDGTLLPKDVVDFARNPKTALHHRFTWDDSKAAEEYRLWQARSIIKVCVKLIPRSDGDDIESRVYVSLYNDRKGGEGYRTLVSVLNNKEQRAQLLAQALGEYEALGRKYNDLTELAKIFSAIAKVRKSEKKTRHGVAATGRAANGATRQGRRSAVRKAG